MQRDGRGIFSKYHLNTRLIFFRSMGVTYLCRFNQRNRLIEVPVTSEYYSAQNGISHEHLKQLISRE